MPRKRDFKRLRRLRLVGAVGALAVLVGGAAACFAVSDAVAHRPGGTAGIAIGGALLVAGVGPTVRALRTHDRVATAEREELRRQGLDDGLPLGVFREQGAIGLEPADLLLVLATLFAGVGLLFLGVGLADPQVGATFAVVFGSAVGGLPAATLLRLGVGTRLWLTPDGLERRRWPRRSVRWDDVTRVVPLSRGVPGTLSGATDALELQTVRRPEARPWRGSGFTIRVMALEVTATELEPIIRSMVPAGRR